MFTQYEHNRTCSVFIMVINCTSFKILVHYSGYVCQEGLRNLSLFFTISNGVRQGGVLSPKLYTFYIDDLSIILSGLNFGCYIEYTCVNHFF